MNLEAWLPLIPKWIIYLNLVWSLFLSLFAITRWKVSEAIFNRIGSVVNICVLVLSFIAWMWALYFGSSIQVDLFPTIHFYDYEFEAVLRLDRLSTLYLFMASLIGSVVNRFSINCLHLDPRFYRFFAVVSWLVFGVDLIALSGSFDVIVIGWELCGIASVLLISFFWENPRAVQNSLMALIHYRTCDIALFGAAVLMHHEFGSSRFDHMHSNFWIALLVVLATLAKSAQFPMSSWLHRAMEGPTPSSAIFYGALSIHLGPFLMLRMLPFYQGDSKIRVVIGLIGLTTAIYASLVGRVRSDAKSSLAYSTLTQVGIQYVEIALGLDVLAMVHIFSHAVFRTFQFLRASSIIQDFQDSKITREDIGSRRGMWIRQYLGKKFSRNLFIHSINGFYLRSLLDVAVVKPVLKISAWFNQRNVMLLVVCLALGGTRFWGYWVVLAMAIYFTVASFSEKSSIKTLLFILISQASLALAGGYTSELGKVAGVILATSSILSLTALLVILRKDRMRASGPLFVVVGVLMNGAPGGLAFVGEDLLFHTFVESGSLFLAFGFIFVGAFNLVSFYQVAIREYHTQVRG